MLALLALGGYAGACENPNSGGVSLTGSSGELILSASGTTTDSRSINDFSQQELEALAALDGDAFDAWIACVLPPITVTPGGSWGWGGGIGPGDGGGEYGGVGGGGGGGAPSIPNYPNNPNPDVACGVTADALFLRVAHVNYRIAIHRSLNNGKPQYGASYRVTYPNGQSENWIAGSPHTSIPAGTPEPGSCG